MKIFEIGDNKIIITLTDTEVLCCFGNYERLFTMSEGVKASFDMLLRDIISEHRSLVNNRKVMVTITAQKNFGCEITLICLERKRSLKSREHVFEFCDTESLTEAMLFLFRKRDTSRLESSLYKMPKSYRLILKYKNRPELKHILSEFCSSFSENGGFAADTKEHGLPLILENAVETYGKYFFKEP